MTKFFLKSTTIQGILLTLSGIALRALGIEVSAETLGVLQAEIVNLFPELLELVGLGVAAWGRVNASGGITLKKGGK